MYRKSYATLIYEADTYLENGSPTTVSIEKEVKVNLMDNFSVNYYNDRAREMRDSLRLNVNVYHTEDIVQGGLSYSLRYVRYHGKKYTVENIMGHFIRAYKNYVKDTMTRDLDLRLSL